MKQALHAFRGRIALISGILLLVGVGALAGANSSVVGNDLGALLGAHHPSAHCSGILPSGEYENVVVLANHDCVLGPGVKIDHDLDVDKGATLEASGTDIGYDLDADSPAGLRVSGTTVGHDIDVGHISGAPSGGGDNAVCSTSVGHDLDVYGGKTSASKFVIGDLASDCGTGYSPSNTVGRDLNVRDNAEPVDVSDNSVSHDLDVKFNTGGTQVQGNHVGYDAECVRNTAFVGGGNTAGHKNQGCG